MVNSDNNKEVASKVEVKDVEVVHELNNKNKFFIFSEKEIELYSDMAREVINKKKAKIDLARGFERKMWKLIVGVAKAQTNTWILKHVGHLGRRCDVCGKSQVKVASCDWMDRQFNRETNEKEERHFVLHSVCEECLAASKASYVHEEMLFDMIMTPNANPTFQGMNDAKSYVCALCNNHESDSTWISVVYEDGVLSIPVCNKHFEAIMHPTDADDKIKLWVSQGLMNVENAMRLRTFKHSGGNAFMKVKIQTPKKKKATKNKDEALAELDAALKGDE